MERTRVLVACSDSSMSVDLCEKVRSLGMDALHATGPAEAMEHLSGSPKGVLLCSRWLSAGDGIELLERVRKRWPGIRRVLVSRSGDETSAADVVNRAGVHYWMEGSCHLQTLRAAIGAESPPVHRRSNTAGPPRRDARFAQIIGESASITNLLDLVSRVAQTASTVLVTGETGTGKELVGRAIHDASLRHEMPFAAVNSAAIPETLLESELFGHRRGSFTGATSDSVGLFEGANRGTVFMDEVGEMPLSMQAKLLRFLQTGEVRPVGARHASHVDVRLVAATNRCLEDEVAAGAFREDLYYRLAVIPIHVPPLRDRIEDIPLLVDHVLRKLARRCGRTPFELDDSALDALVQHRWPGNVRELENVIERAVALTKGEYITADDLPLFERPRTALARTGGPESLPSIERRHIIETLEHVGWNRKRAAEILQISTTTLWRRLKQFGIETQTTRPTISSSD